MKVKVYENYGMLAKEKRRVYTVYPASEIREEITVEIPDEIITGKNMYDELIINLDGHDYLLSEVLCGNEFPHLVIPGEAHSFMMLKIVKC